MNQTTGFSFFLVASVLGKNWVVSISPEDLSMFFMEQGRRDREFGFLQWDAVFNYLLCANLCWFGPFWMRFPLVTSHDITCFAKTVTLYSNTSFLLGDFSPKKYDLRHQMICRQVVKFPYPPTSLGLAGKEPGDEFHVALPPPPQSGCACLSAWDMF